MRMGNNSVHFSTSHMVTEAKCSFDRAYRQKIRATASLEATIQDFLVSASIKLPLAFQLRPHDNATKSGGRK